MSAADVSSHAPLTTRLRGEAFLPGVHYAVQVGAWMREAADEIDRQTVELAMRRTAPDRALAALTLAVGDCNQRITTEPGEAYHLGYMAALLLALDLLTSDQPEVQP